MKPEIRIAEDAQDLERMAAAEFTVLAVEAVSRKGIFSVALSGGSTPRGLYGLLADPVEPFAGRIAWGRCHVFWGDERHVPPDHPESNYRMARETLLSRVPVPPQNIHRVRAEEPDAERAAGDYDAKIKAFFQLEEGRWPRFDLVLLGLGADGHTASLFPGSSILNEKRRTVAAGWVERLGSYRITLTLPVLNHAACAAFLAVGAAKARIVSEILGGPSRPNELPARRVHPVDGKVIWFLDRAAAACLTD